MIENGWRCTLCGKLFKSAKKWEKHAEKCGK